MDKNYKYETAYEDVALLMRKYVASYKPEVERFFKIVVFNYLFSNGDGHLKRFRLVQTIDGDYVLSPAYDLLCTALHTRRKRHGLTEGLFEGDYKCAGFEKHGFCTGGEFLEFANRIGMVPKRAERFFRNF